MGPQMKVGTAIGGFLTIEGGGVYFLWGVGVEVFSTNFQIFLIGFFPAAQNSSQDRDVRGFAKKS